MKEALSYGFRCTVDGCNKPARDAAYGVCSDHRVGITITTASTEGGAGGLVGVISSTPNEESSSGLGDPPGASSAISNREFCAHKLRVIGLYIATI